MEQEVIKQEVNNPSSKFGMFQGVFTPTLLTILGVIMYLREPWVVGNAGVLGAIGIITLATAITLCTSLSMSSIVTNIRIKAGGAFSIISQSLGLEAGGAIGIPLYIAQAFAVAMYIFGFREGWLWLFPNHSALLVDLATFALIFAIANISTSFAFKIQYVVLAIIALSIVSIGMGFIDNPINTDIRWFGNYEGSVEDSFSGTNFWVVFAVYFPAVTGIMAGANMSGDLENPRASIPTGTLAAVVLSYFVYVAMAILIAFLATPQELLENYNILIDKSYVPELVLAGLLGATFSSALSSLVGAPRILNALGQNNILFMNDKLAKVDKNGEPKISLYITSGIVLLSLLLRDLNAIAPLLTMFFLITYAMVNVVVLVEQGLGQLSFRPTLRVPILVPLLGAAGCFLVMFIINATIGILSMGLVMAMYVYLTKRKNLANEDGDSRSGMFNSLAEWSAKVVEKLPEANERAWQPNLLLPAQKTEDVVRSYKTIYSLARPKGSVKVLGFYENTHERDKLNVRLTEITDYFLEQGISAAYAPVQNPNLVQGALTSMQCMKASFFTPNTLFLSLTDEKGKDGDLVTMMRGAKEYGYGAYLYAPFQKVGLGLEKSINLWLNDSDWDFESETKVNSINLALLTGFLLRQNWKAKLNIVVQVANLSDLDRAKEKIEKLMLFSRLKFENEPVFVFGSFENSYEIVARADLNIFSVSADSDGLQQIIRQHTERLETSCLFTMDGPVENVLA